ncbi:MAG: crosslink repair DNA glycosylase YcaQ family protein [Candidatus Didemnitutus sp.]|nr:crosslink repair DNA glycosylase YcaQ family protein [Candidatus Didemnitutus sp.]
MPAPLTLSPASARRFLRRALLLDAPVPNLTTALEHHGYIQIDPINVCGRMHDLILRNRVAGYREGDLMRHLHGVESTLPAARRHAFEHHLPSTSTLVAFPLAAWPHLLTVMCKRTRRSGVWSGRLTLGQRQLAPELLTEIAARGPLSSEDFTDTGRSRHVWGAATQAKATLQKLFFHGRLLIARRGSDNRRYYDLPEKILPASVLAQRPPPAAETARWEIQLKLRQRRLVRLMKKELPLVEDLVQAVHVDGCPLLHCLRSDLPLLDRATLEATPSTSLLLAPLDPLIYDRRVTSMLWGFDYTWEVYTPPAKRVRGYYALPVLSGTEIIGHVDSKADRQAGRLRVVSRQPQRGTAVSRAVRELATWLQLK